MPQVLNRQRRVTVATGRLEAFARRVAGVLRLGADSFTVCLLRDAEMARMNRQFRGKRGPTDVLSFPAGDGGSGRRKQTGRAGFLGDIAIAPQVAQRNARQSGRSLENELRILILHGALHLMGYDHEIDSGQMERREGRLRRQLGIA